MNSVFKDNERGNVCCGSYGHSACRVAGNAAIHRALGGWTAHEGWGLVLRHSCVRVMLVHHFAMRLLRLDPMTCRRLLNMRARRRQERREC